MLVQKSADKNSSGHMNFACCASDGYVFIQSRLHIRARYDFAYAQTNKQTNKQKELKSENIPAVVRGCLEAKGSELASCKSQIFCTFYALNLFCSDMCRILCRILSTQRSLSKPLCCSFLVCQR